MRVSDPLGWVVIPPQFIGDCVLTTAVVQWLLDHTETPLGLICPESIHWLFRALWPDTPRLTLIDSHHARGVHLYSHLKQRKPAGVLLLRRSFTNALMARGAGVPKRVGFAWQRLPTPLKWQPSHLNLTHWTPYHPETPYPHELQHYGLLLKEAFGLATAPRLSLAAVCPQGSGAWLRVIRQGNHGAFSFAEVVGCVPDGHERQPVGVHWSSASQAKQRSPLELAGLVASLVSSGRYWVFLSGAPTDAAPYAELIDALPAPVQPYVINGAGQTSLKDLPALLTNLHTLISLDSAPIHLAGLVGLPLNVHALFAGDATPSHPERWGIERHDLSFTPYVTLAELTAGVSKILL
jgi:ADP-heptose:LPS heptosyltransferase